MYKRQRKARVVTTPPAAGVGEAEGTAIAVASAVAEPAARPAPVARARKSADLEIVDHEADRLSLLHTGRCRRTTLWTSRGCRAQ